MEQDFRTTGSPIFAALTLSNLGGSSIVGTNGTRGLISMALTSNNGMVMSSTFGDFTVSTPQDIRQSAAPIFRNVSVTNSVYFIGSSGTMVASNTFTTPTYSTIILHDPAGMYDPTNARFTVPTAGYYDLTASIRISDQAIGPGPDTTGLSFTVNGSQVGAMMWSSPDGAGRRTTTLQWAFVLNAGDYVQVAFFQNSGVTLQAQRLTMRMVQVA